MRLSWDKSKDPTVVGYIVHYGTEAGKYTKTVRVVGKSTTIAVIQNLEKGKTYFFALTSYNAKGKESPFSAEVSSAPGKRDSNRRPNEAGPPGTLGPSSDPRPVKSPGEDNPAEGLKPSLKRIPPSRNVLKGPDGKILPSR